MELENLNGSDLKEIRLRLGWCTAELARHLSMKSEDIFLIEQSQKPVSAELKSACAELIRFADDYAFRIQQDPFAEKIMNKQRLSQVTGAALFQLNEKDFIE